MSGSYRGLAATALIAAILIAFGLGAFVSGLDYPEQRYQSYQNGKADKEGAFSTVTDLSRAVVERTPCNQPQSESESDLCAQWRAAKAAERSADWTFYGFWATLAGMALLTWQIMLTREAVKDTGDATKAMNRANDLAAAAQRAWIEIEPKISILAVDREWVNVKAFSQFQNNGKSVATNVSVATKFLTCPPGQIVAHYNELFRKIYRSQGGLTLMPGKHLSRGQTRGGFNRDQVKWGEEGKAVFGVIAVVSYNIEGSDIRRFTGAIFTMKVDREHVLEGVFGLTWEEFTSPYIVVDPDGLMFCR